MHFMNKQRARHFGKEQAGHSPAAEHDPAENEQHDGKPHIFIHSHAGGHNVHIHHADGRHEMHEHAHGDAEGIAEHIHRTLGNTSGDEHEYGPSSMMSREEGGGEV